MRLTLSFRSTNDVLHAVDRVFASADVRRGITHDPDPVRHDAIRHDAPGYVEIWPSVAASSVEEPDDWTRAIDHAQAPAVKVAELGILRREVERVQFLIRREAVKLANPQPLGREVLHQGVGLLIGEHATELGAAHRRVAQRAGAGKAQQLAIRHAAPKEVRKP